MFASTTKALARKALATTACAAAVVLALAQPGMARDATTIQAYGVQISALGVTLGPEPLANAATPTATLANASGGSLFTSGTLTATANIQPGFETSSATVQNINMSFLGAGFTATAISSTCTAVTGDGISGSASVGGGTLTGPFGVPTITIPANPAPNTTFSIPGVVTLIANEQVTNPDGSLTVNALHFIFASGAGDVIVASSTCGPSAVPVPMVSASGLVLAGGLGLVGLVGYQRWRPGRLGRRGVS